MSAPNTCIHFITSTWDKMLQNEMCVLFSQIICTASQILHSPSKTINRWSSKILDFILYQTLNIL